MVILWYVISGIFIWFERLHYSHCQKHLFQLCCMLLMFTERLMEKTLNLKQKRTQHGSHIFCSPFWWIQTLAFSKLCVVVNHVFDHDIISIWSKKLILTALFFHLGTSPDDLQGLNLTLKKKNLTILIYYLVGGLVQVAAPLLPGNLCLIQTCIA